MINNDEFKIPGEYYAKPNNNIDLSWINYPDVYKEIEKQIQITLLKLIMVLLIIEIKQEMNLEN